MTKFEHDALQRILENAEKKTTKIEAYDYIVDHLTVFLRVNEVSK